MPISNERRTPSVAGPPRRAAHLVRRLAVMLAFAGALGATPARAAEPTATATTEATAQPGQSPASEPAGYALPLGLAYAGAPLLALALGGGMSKLTTDDTVSVVVGSLAFALPAVVHFSHGETRRGIFALPALVGVTFLGAALGGYSGVLLHPLSCGRDSGTESCDDTLPVSLVAGAVIGGVLGYATYATIDITMNSTPSRRSRVRDVASLQLWIQPLESQTASMAAGIGRSSAPVGEHKLTGALLGAAFEL